MQGGGRYSPAVSRSLEEYETHPEGGKEQLSGPKDVCSWNRARGLMMKGPMLEQGTET